MIISVDAEITHLTKCSNLSRYKPETVNYLDIINTKDEKNTANIILYSQRLKGFPLTSRGRQACTLSAMHTHYYSTKY